MNPSNWIGKKLKKRYTIDEYLGQGGMSTVFKGFDPNLSRPVAIKIIHSFLAMHDKFLQRFQQEAAAVARLRHPHILQVYDFDETEGDYFMIMEWIDGGTLQEKLRSLLNNANERMTIGEIITILHKICGAVDYAHKQQMIHRDLKPANIMIRKDGEPILMDFGIAKMLDRNTSLTNTGAIMGTVSYMSPEQVRGDEIDHRADIYSLGVILFELLTGQRPYDAETQFATMMKHLHDPLPNLLDAVEAGDVHQIESLTSVIQQAMAKNREDRFQSAAQMQQSLLAVLALPHSDLTTILHTSQTFKLEEGGETPSAYPSPEQARDQAKREILSLMDDLEQDPLREDKQQLLLELYARRGEFLIALKQYNSYQRLLQDELQVEPMPDTIALRDRIMTARMTPAHNLQPDVTPFVGRETELGQLTALLHQPDYRLINLLGSGGMGKTRLARAVMRQISDHQWRTFLHGTFFIPLAAAETAEDIIYSLAKSCDIALSGQTDPLNQLITFFKGREVLLVFDNFEHLVPHAGLIYQLLDAIPYMKCLVTSRQRLNLPGENIFPLGGLHFIEPIGRSTDTLSLDDGTRLFLQASRKLNPHFKLNENNQFHVYRICSLVDGMPLGIELAASWTRLLSCGEIVERLESGLDILATDQSQIPERHRDIRAVFLYSWELLSAEERTILARLSIFRAQFEFEAAHAITGATLEQLRTLVDKSLLQVVLIDERTQTPVNQVYTIHETVRYYAAEKMAAHRDEAREIETLHIAFYSRFLAKRRETLLGRGQREAWEEIAQNLDNIRQAWQLAAARGEVDSLQHGLESLYHYYTMGGLNLEGAQQFETAAAQLTDTPPTFLEQELLNRQAAFYVRLARYPEAQVICENSLEILQQSAEPDARREKTFLLGVLSEVHWRQGRFEKAEELIREALADNKQQNDIYGRATILNQLGIIRYLQGDFAGAYGRYNDSLQLFEQLGNDLNASRIKANLALYQVAMQRFEEGKKGLQADLEIARLWQNKPKMAVDLLNLAWADIALKRYEEAQHNIEESRVYYQDVGDQEGEATTLILMGQIAWEQKQTAVARRHFANGLQLSLDVQAIPKALECIVSLCLFLTEIDPHAAWSYCHFATGHERANKMTHTRAEPVIGQLADLLSEPQKEALKQQVGNLDLDKVSRDLLDRFGR